MPSTVLIYFSYFLNMIFYSFILLVGLMLCKKYKFRGGFYFFLLLLVNQIFSMVYPRIIQKIIENRMDLLHTYYVQLSYVFSIIEMVIQICAFLILLITLHKMFTKRDIVGQILEKIKYKALHHKKITVLLITIFLLILTIMLLVGSTKDFELISAKVQITNDPSTGIVSVSKEGEDPILPDQYIEYTVVIHNKKNKQFGGSRDFVQLNFIPSKETVSLFGEEVFNNRRGYSGPGFFEANETKEFTIVYGISDDANMNIESLEAQALNGKLILSSHQKKLAKFVLK